MWSLSLQTLVNNAFDREYFMIHRVCLCHPDDWQAELDASLEAECFLCDNWSGATQVHMLRLTDEFHIDESVVLSQFDQWKDLWMFAAEQPSFKGALCDVE